MSEYASRIAARLNGAIVVLVLLSIPVFAQRPPSDVDPARARFEDTNRREMQLRGMGGNPKKIDPKQVEAIAAQIKQDFERIVSLHNLIAKAVGVDEVLDHDFVSSSTMEIKKRASRLQTTLALDKLGPLDQNQHKLKNLAEPQLRDNLSLLCKQIESFISNPVIENPSVVDVSQLSNARHDLEGVIELADGINKFVDRQKKPSH